MKKFIFYFVFSLVALCNVFSFDELNFYRNGKYYGVFLKNTEEHWLNNTFSALNNIERDQVHKIMLNTMEKSRIQSLAFVGDKYEFNGVQLQSVLYRDDNLKYAGKKYKITDKNEKYSVTFSIGDYDTIVLHSQLEFVDGKKKEIEDIDNKYATIFTVKRMLAQIIGQIIAIYDLPQVFKIHDFEDDLLNKIEKKEDKRFFINSYKNNGKVYVLLDTVSIEQQKLLLKIYNDAYAIKGYNERQRLENLNAFVQQLQKMDKDKVFDHLTKYVNLNIQIINDDYNITGLYQSPADVYYTGTADYKSVCLFYYYVLSRLNFNVRMFLVEDMIQKQPKIAKLSSKKSKIDDEVDEKKLYRNVRAEFAQIQNLYKFESPKISNAIMLVAVEQNKNGVISWQYSTGKKWNLCPITDPNRVCQHFMKNGCYYADVSEREYHILHNFPIDDDFVKWSVYF